MTTLSDRLRGVIGGGLKAHGGSERRGASSGAPGTDDAIAEVLDGEWHERSGQRFLVVDRMYVPGYRHGSLQSHLGGATRLPAQIPSLGLAVASERHNIEQRRVVSVDSRIDGRRAVIGELVVAV